MKVTRPSGRISRVAGLPMSCSRAPKRSAWARVSSSARVSPSTARSGGSASALELDQPAQHLQRVVVDVEMVVVALLHAVQRRQLGQHRGEQSEPVGQRQAVEHAVGDHQPAQLGEHALAGRLGHARRRGPREPLGLGVGAEAELGAEAGQAQRAQRVALVGARAQHPQGARLDVRLPAVRIDQLAARARAGHRVHAEVALGQVLLDRLALERRQVEDAPAARDRSHARRRTPPRGGTRDRAARPPSSRASGSGSPATAMSTSRTGRPSSSSRSAPPTIQASLTARARAAPGPRGRT